jgi:hypothetical protein
VKQRSPGARRTPDSLVRAVSGLVSLFTLDFLFNLYIFDSFSPSHVLCFFCFFLWTVASIKGDYDMKHVINMMFDTNMILVHEVCYATQKIHLK